MADLDTRAITDSDMDTDDMNESGFRATDDSGYSDDDLDMDI